MTVGKRGGRGNNQGGRKAAKPFTVLAGAPEMPESIRSIPEAKAIWERSVPRLVSVGLVNAEDGPTFATFIMAQLKQKEAAALFKKHGSFIKDPKTGMPKVAPWTRVLEKCERVITNLSRAFGLDASARAEIAAKRGKNPDAHGGKTLTPAQSKAKTFFGYE